MSDRDEEADVFGGGVPHVAHAYRKILKYRNDTKIVFAVAQKGQKKAYL